MLSLIDPQSLGYDTITLPEELRKGQGGSPSGSHCPTCSAFQPAPRLDGSLQVDPEIHLPSPGMDVDIAYYYNSNSLTVGNFGLGRTISPNILIQASGTPTIVTITRGNGAVVSYQDDGSGNFIPKTMGLINTLTKDTTHNLWKELNPAGETTAWPLNTAGRVTSVSYIQDAVGNAHTFAYQFGLLSSLTDMVGRKVSFSYEANNQLQTIQDWAGRLTTFIYDADSIPGSPLLTGVTGPSGCQTGYQYDGSGYLTGILDPNGYGTSYSYDANGRILTRTVAGAGVTTYTYSSSATQIHDALGQMSTYMQSSGITVAGRTFGGIIDALGTQVTMTRNSLGQETSRQNALGAITTRTYNSKGLTTGLTDALGRMTTIMRDAYNNPTSVMAADGTVTTQVWGYTGSSFDTTGYKRRLQASVDPLGNRTSYSYNAMGQMASVQDALGNLTTYGYDGFGNPVSVQDALGHITTSVYDQAGNVVARVDPLGNYTSYSYDSQNRPVMVTDPLGNIRTTAYDGVGNVLITIDSLGYRTSYTYNVFDRPVTVTDPMGNIITNSYDQLGRGVSVVDTLGNITTTVYDASGNTLASINPLGQTTTTIYDLAKRIIGTVDALGHRNTSIYDMAGQITATIDPLGCTTTNIYNSRGSIITQIDPQGYRTTVVYNALSQNVANVDALGNRTTSIYDISGRTIATEDSLGYLSTIVYDAAGRVHASVDALGNHTTTIYDVSGRAVAVQDPLGRLRTTVYDAVGRVVAKVDPLGNRATYQYDSSSKVISRQDARGHVWTNVYDANQNLYATISPLGNRTTYIHDKSSRLLALQNALGSLTSMLYDGAGRDVAVINPLGFRSTTIYNAAGQHLARVDANGHVTSTLFDMSGRQSSIQSALGYFTTYLYNLSGQRIATIDANGHATTTLYDARGNQISIQDALGVLISYQYDAAGNQTWRQDARGQVTTYAFDALGRIVSQTYADGSQVLNTYDAAGQLTSVLDNAGVTTYTYNLNGRQTQVSYPTGNILAHAYDPVGNRTLLLDPDSGRTTYAYDAQNRLTSISNPFNEVTTIAYDPLDRELLRTYANGMWVSHTYDAAGQETALHIGPDVQSTVPLLLTATYDPAGNRNAMTEHLSSYQAPPSFTSYTYDAANQILLENRFGGSSNYTTSHTYDPVGNILTKGEGGQITRFSYNAANEQTLVTPPTGAPTTLTYDPNGSLALQNAAGVLTTYAWDGENRLTNIATSPTMETHSYNADGLRQQKNTYDQSGSMDNVWVEDATPTGATTYGTNGDTWNWVSSNPTPFSGSLCHQSALYSGDHQHVFIGGTPTLSIVTGDVLVTYVYLDPVNTPSEVMLQWHIGASDWEHRAYWGANLISAGVNGTVSRRYMGPLPAVGQWVRLEVPAYLVGVEGMTLNGMAFTLYGGMATWDHSGKATLTSTQFVWDEQNVLQETDGSGATTAQYTDNPGNWGGLVSQNRSGVSHFYGSDMSANIRLLTDATNAVTDSYFYDAFGKELSVSGSTVNPLRFGGQVGYYRDAANRLYVRARYLDTLKERWISRDPIRFGEEAINLYRYVKNQPVSFIDATGLCTYCGANIGTYGTPEHTWIGIEMALQVKWGRVYHLLINGALGGPAVWSKPVATAIWGCAPLPDLHYVGWAGQNQGYKNMPYLSTTSTCGTCHRQWDSFSLCGHCVTGDILGNIMYGYVAALLGYDETYIVNAIPCIKKRFLRGSPEIKKTEYRFGYQLYKNLGPVEYYTSISHICDKFNATLATAGFQNVLKQSVDRDSEQTLSYSDCCICKETSYFDNLHWVRSFWNYECWDPDGGPDCAPAVLFEAPFR